MRYLFDGCKAFTTLPAGDPNAPWACYSPALAGLMFAAVLVVVGVLVLGVWLARRERPEEIDGPETIITRDGTWTR